MSRHASGHVRRQWRSRFRQGRSAAGRAAMWKEVDKSTPEKKSAAKSIRAGHGARHHAEEAAERPAAEVAVEHLAAAEQGAEGAERREEAAVA